MPVEDTLSEGRTPALTADEQAKLKKEMTSVRDGQKAKAKAQSDRGPLAWCGFRRGTQLSPATEAAAIDRRPATLLARSRPSEMIQRGDGRVQTVERRRVE